MMILELKINEKFVTRNDIGIEQNQWCRDAN